MNDAEIVKLYIRRDEAAIRETDVKYGRFCHTIANNILSVQEDAEECVNDTYLKAWDSIPPQKPDCLKVWLGKIVRNCMTKASVFYICFSNRCFIPPDIEFNDFCIVHLHPSFRPVLEGPSPI